MTAIDKPYSICQKTLKQLLHEGEVLQPSLLELERQKNTLDTGGVIAKVLLPDHDRTIGTMKRALKSNADLKIANLELSIIDFLRRSNELIGSIPTGRRKSDMKVGTQKELMKRIQMALRQRSPRTKLSDGLSVISQTISELAMLEAKWASRTTLIEGGRPVSARITIENLLSSDVSGYLKVCDPYCSEESLSVLEATPISVPIKLFTTTPRNEECFASSLKKLRSIGRDIQIAIMEDKELFPHDRFLISEKRGWIVGGSLKDLGKRMTTITCIDNKAELEEILDRYLSGARGSIRYI